MLVRLIFGALLGAILGGIVAAALVKGLGILAFGAMLAYVAAAITGVLAGLFTGKPIWTAGGKIEAGLKAFFGALLATGACSRSANGSTCPSTSALLVLGLASSAPFQRLHCRSLRACSARSS